MNVKKFKKVLIDIAGNQGYLKDREFFMKVYAAAVRNNELSQLSQTLDDLHERYLLKKPITNPASYFAEFIEYE
jgi:hypothetical protein